MGRSPKTRLYATLLTLCLASVALAGCATYGQSTPQVRKIRFWVEEMDWEVHPGLSTKVWAFCAEGDGVEPVWDGPCGVPGPTIRVNDGDIIRLTFDNTHTIPHTVHFHGEHPFASDMNGNGLLGEGMVVQGGESLQVEWKAGPAGSFIYHCHFDTPVHMDMGMYGAFIVEKEWAKDPDRQEFVAVLDEWKLGGGPEWDAGLPDYDHYTINGKSFPLTQPMMVDVGDDVRIHMVNAGYRFHAMHLHGYIPTAREGVAPERSAVLTDVKEIAPGQTVVLDFEAKHEGIWLFHDHVVPHVTAGGDDGPGLYPSGMLTALVVGEEAQQAFLAKVPEILEALGFHEQADAAKEAAAPGGTTIAMQGFTYAEKELHVKAGTPVTWVNNDPAYHTVTLADSSVDSGRIEPGESWTHTFEKPGTYEYYCIPHASQGSDGKWKGMVATLVVEPA